MVIFWNSLEHGIPKSTEIQKNIPYYGAHIFWLGVTQGSQKTILKYSMNILVDLRIEIMKKENNQNSHDSFWIKIWKNVFNF